MKKILKAAASLILAAALLIGTLPALSVAAGAEGKLSTSVEYAEDGSALVTIKASASGNKILYTLDGSVPSMSSFSSLSYSGSIIITNETLLRAAEFSPDGKKIKGIKRIITPKAGEKAAEKTEEKVVETTETTETTETVENTEKPAAVKTANPVFTLTCKEGSTAVSITCSAEGALIYYTTSGAAPDHRSYIYTKEIVVTEASVIKAVASCQGAEDSEIISVYVPVAQVGDDYAEPEPEMQSLDDDEEAETFADPSDVADIVADDGIVIEETNKKPEPDTSEAAKVSAKINHTVTYLETGGCYVTLRQTKTGYTTYYTTDGKAPTKEKGKKYSSRIKFTEPALLRAYEYNKKGEIVSKISINVKPSCAVPTMVCIDFSGTTRTIEFETKTEGADIYYTIDGSDPEKSKFRMKYTAPFMIGTFESLRVIAVKDGYRKSNELRGQVSEASCVLNDFNFGDPVYSEFIALVNTERRKAGLSDLQLNEKLTYAASIRAVEAYTYFSHNRLNGKSYTQVYDDVKLDRVVRSTSEMLLRGKSPQDIMKTILSNEGEKELILNSLYNSLGVGRFEDGMGNITWVVLTCRLD